MKSLSRRARLGLGACVSLLGVLGVIAVAGAQGFDPRTPRTVVVGAPKTESSMFRVTPWRDGRTPSALPTKKLHVDWRKSTGAPSESPALVDETGRRSRRNMELVDGVVPLLHDVVVVIVG